MYPLLFWAQAQNTERLIQLYSQVKDEKHAYDIALEIMESNASLTIEEARNICKPLRKKEDKLSILSYSILADVFYYKNQLDSSLYYYLSAAEEAKSLKDYAQVASNLGNSAYVLSELDKQLQALSLLKEALHYANQSSKKEHADIHYNLYNTFNRLNKIDSAIYHLNKTIEADKRTNNKKGMCSNLVALANLQLQIEANNQALENCSICVDYALELNNAYEINRCKAMKARVLLSLDSKLEAKQEIEDVLRRESQRKDSSRLSNYLGLYARILYANGNATKAYEELNKSIQIAHDVKKTKQEGSALLMKVNFLIEESNLDEAKVVLEYVKTLNISDELFQNNLWSVKADVAKRSGNYREAFLYLEKLKQKESAQKQYVSTSVFSSNDVLAAFRLEQENKALFQKKEALESKSRLILLLFFSGLLLSLATGISIYFWVQTQKRKREILSQEAIQQKKELENQLLNTELSALRAQMNPHFLFNCLSSINDFIMHEDPKTASKYLTKFSHLMRMILNNSKQKMISLDQELEALSLYVEMENLRLNNRITYNVRIDQALDASSVLIPSMIIQPFIENCIKHGIGPKQDKGKIELEFQDKGGFINVVIIDDGIGRTAALKRQKQKNRLSFGTSITSERLRLINKALPVSTSITYEDLIDPVGTKAILRISKTQDTIANENRIKSDNYR